MNEPAATTETSPANVRVLPDAWIERLFGRLEGLYGAKFHDAWRGTDTENVKRTWAEKLGGFADRPEALKAALDACDDKPWPPTLPEFRALCTPMAEDLGLPTPDAAYREAALADKDHRWSHPVVYAAAQATGLFELRTLPESKSRPLFERAYEIVTRRVLAGEQFDVPIPQALAKLPVPARPETASAALAAMRETLRVP